MQDHAEALATACAVRSWAATATNREEAVRALKYALSRIVPFASRCKSGDWVTWAARFDAGIEVDAEAALDIGLSAAGGAIQACDETMYFVRITDPDSCL